MGRFAHIKAEDILAEEAFRIELCLNSGEGDNTDDKPVSGIVRRLYSFLTAPPKKMSESAKEDLRERIYGSLLLFGRQWRIKGWTLISHSFVLFGSKMVVNLKCIGLWRDNNL